VGFDEESWKDDLASPTDLQEDWYTECELTGIVTIGSNLSSDVLLSCYSSNVSITESYRIILHYAVFVCLCSIAEPLVAVISWISQDATATPAVPELPESMMGEVAEVTFHQQMNSCHFVP
jgi:hypothetical protein